MKQIKDFAVSSQEAGFDEFLKVFNEYFKLSCRGEFLFYGASDGQPQRDDIRWTNKFILPHAAIALLTGKQLTEGEQLTDKSKHKLLYSNLTKDFTWCGVCNEHFHNSEGYHDVKLLPTQESVKEREKPCANCKETIAECACMRNICVKCNKPVGNITFSHCDKCFDILHSEPTQESVKERNGDPSMDEMIQLVEQLESDKFHLQQQLKQANLLLLNVKNTIELNNIQKVFPETHPQINQFLTRNQ